MKKYFIGSMAVIMAITTSAFTVNNNKADGDVYAFKSATSQYTKLSEVYDMSNCVGSGNDTCAYKVTSAGASHVSGSSFTQSQRDTYLSNGWIERISPANKVGTYDGD